MSEITGSQDGTLSIAFLLYIQFLVKLVELPLQTYQPKRTVAHAMTFSKIIPTLSKLWWWFLKELLALLTKRPLI